jgi:hypothetical protein
MLLGSGDASAASSGAVTVVMAVGVWLVLGESFPPVPVTRLHCSPRPSPCNSRAVALARVPGSYQSPCSWLGFVESDFRHGKGVRVMAALRGRALTVCIVGAVAWFTFGAAGQIASAGSGCHTALI